MASQHREERDNSQMEIVTIKFRDAGKRYNFNANELELKVGQQVVVETDRGRALGTVVAPTEEREDQTPNRELKNVVRHATEEDLKLASVNATREQEALVFCTERISQRGMDMKLVKAEYLFDGSKIIFFFTADGRVDFRELVKDLAHHFHTRIEMRQIGVRDEAKLVGGIGVCGRELCCCTFLTDFTPVSVKMAKEQGLALNPSKISGQCGRLLCCLSYEFETYCKMRKGLPKCGKKIEVCGCKTQVLDVNVLGQEVTLATEDGQRLKVTAEQLESGDIEELTEAGRKAASENRRQRDAGGRSGQRGRGGSSENRRTGTAGGGRRKEDQSEGEKSARPQGRDQQRRKARSSQKGRPQTQDQQARSKAQSAPDQEQTSAEQDQQAKKQGQRSRNRAQKPRPQDQQSRSQEQQNRKPQQETQQPAAPGEGQPKRRRRRRRRKPQATE